MSHDNSMKKIAFVINSLTNGGAERTISNITTHLPGEYDVDIIVNNASETTYPISGNIISLGLKPQKNKLKLFYQLVLFVKRVSVLKKLKKNNGYKCVISFSESANIANILSGKEYTKVCLSIRTHMSHYADVPLYRLFGFPAIKLLYKRADVIVAVSEGVSIDLIDNFHIPREIIKVIGNGVDSDRVQKLSSEELTEAEEKLLAGKRVIVTVGRLVREKGQWHLIRALSRLKENGEAFSLLIIGDGDMRKQIQNTVSECDLSDRVIFLGHINNPFKYLSRAALFVFPSVTEGMGNGLIEALACGLPCISTDHESGAREILAPDTDVKIKNKSEIEYAQYGILVPVCDGLLHDGESLTKEEEIMAEAIEIILNDDSLREGYRNKAQERAHQMDINIVTQKWIDTIEG